MELLYTYIMYVSYMQKLKRVTMLILAKKVVGNVFILISFIMIERYYLMVC